MYLRAAQPICRRAAKIPERKERETREEKKKRKKRPTHAPRDGCIIIHCAAAGPSKQIARPLVWGAGVVDWLMSPVALCTADTSVCRGQRGARHAHGLWGGPPPGPEDSYWPGILICLAGLIRRNKRFRDERGTESGRERCRFWRLGCEDGHGWNERRRLVGLVGQGRARTACSGSLGARFLSLCLSPPNQPQGMVVCVGAVMDDDDD